VIGLRTVAIAEHALDDLPFALVDSLFDPRVLYDAALVAWPHLRRLAIRGEMPCRARGGIS
jgi:hypothetical protein